MTKRRFPYSYDEGQEIYAQLLHSAEKDYLEAEFTALHIETYEKEERDNQLP
ncbi:MAG: hypothetical protein KKF54_06760 [Candidatus Omnitrophica bacterium]|nr:hypothetical protein [Candidatus Omnitrophota bacterium]